MKRETLLLPTPIKNIINLVTEKGYTFKNFFIIFISPFFNTNSPNIYSILSLNNNEKQKSLIKSLILLAFAKKHKRDIDKAYHEPMMVVFTNSILVTKR